MEMKIQILSHSKITKKRRKKTKVKKRMKASELKAGVEVEE